MFSTPSASDLLRAVRQNADFVVACRAADVAIEIARDEEAREGRAAAAKRGARRLSARKDVRAFRAALARFAAESQSTDANDAMLRAAERVDAALRGGIDAPVAALCEAMLLELDGREPTAAELDAEQRSAYLDAIG